MAVSLYDIHIYRVGPIPGNMWKEMSGVENAEVFFFNSNIQFTTFLLHENNIFFPCLFAEIFVFKFEITIFSGL